MPENEEEVVKNFYEVPQKFYRDEQGHYWEVHKIGTQNVFVPAPDWAGNINAYLFEGPNILIESQRKPLCDVPELRPGAYPVDNGNLLLSDEAKHELLRTDPHAEPLIRQYMGGKEFLYNIPRWCLWLVGAEPADIRKCPRVLERIEKVRKFRLSSKSEQTRKTAETPMLFWRPRECTKNYLAIPKTSSETRKYIPIGWLPPEIIAGDALFVCPDATLYQFGILNSSVHNAWLKVISGRLTSRIRYSNTLDYNSFPWPILPEPPVKPGEPRKINPVRLEIEATAQAILDARAKYLRSTLAELYDERTMPPELRKAHNANDAAVMKAYGFERHYQDERFHEEDIVINLMFMYKDLTGCKEFKEGYPNRDFWLSYYPEDAEDDEELEEAEE